MEKASLLIVDDEKEVLNALHRVLRKHFELFLFSDPLEALAFYRDKPYIPLILTDMRMPVMDGATFLGKIIEINPNSKRFLLTGHADINLTVAAVNDGKITHYFSKPWDNVELIGELKASYELYLNERKTKHLLKANQEKNAQLSLINSSLELETNKNKKKLELVSSREAKSFVRLKKTFSTFIEIYAETISWHTEDATRHNFRIASHARLMAEKLNCDKLMIFQIYISGLLYETGKLSLSQNLLNKSVDTMDQHERAQFDGFYTKGISLLSRVDELAYVIEIIKHIPEFYNGLGLPEHLKGEEIPLGSRILSIVIMYDNLLIGRQTQAKILTAEAKHRIQDLGQTMFDANLVKTYLQALEQREDSQEGTVEYLLNVGDLQSGNVLKKDIINSDKSVLLTAGTVIEQHHIDKLLDIEKEFNQCFIAFV